MYYELETIPQEQPKIQLPALGTWFLVSAKAVKVHEPESDICTQWKRQRIEERKMMFIGVRKVREGRMISEDQYDYEDGFKIAYVGTNHMFQSTRFIDVWLFVKDMHSKPVHCLPGDCAIIPF